LSNNTTNVLILGAGYGGSVVANTLARELRKEIARDELEITILDKSGTFINQAGFTFIPFDLFTPEELIMPRKKLISPRVNAFYGEDGEVTNVDLKKREVTVKSNKKYNYDYLVIALGCQAAPEKTPGLLDDYNTFFTTLEDTYKLKEKLMNFDKGRVVISVANYPIPCSGAPVKFSFMYDSYLRHVKNKRKDIEIAVAWPIEGIGPPEFNKFVSGELEKKEIELHRNFITTKVDANKKEITSERGETLKYDLLISVPPQKTNPVLIKSGIADSKGWVPADTTSLQYKGPNGIDKNVFVIGDSGDASILKTGIATHYQAVTVSQTLFNMIKGYNIIKPYYGKAGCPMITELETAFTDGRGYIPTWKYNQPNEAYKTTRLGWYIYRMYYHLHWEMSVKGMF